MGKPFDELQRWLAALPDQVDGDPCAVCQTGEYYREFIECGIVRPGDEEFVERIVAYSMQSRLQKYFENRKGRIYWRIRFESEVGVFPQVVRYDPAGLDKDFITDKPCVMDRNWKRIACYARLYRAHVKTMEAA